MKQESTQKGITLVALVITIIVLMILAGVTISMVLADNGIIGQAQNANSAQENGKGKEEGAISNAEGTISQYTKEKYETSKDEKGIATQNSTVNGEGASANNPVIPKGFKAIKKDETNEIYYDVEVGFIIQDVEGNQFVWVPVENMNDFKRLTAGYSNGSPQSPSYIGREPDLLTGAKTTEGISDLNKNDMYDGIKINREKILEEGYENTNIGLKKQFTDEYNNMVKSVETYGGFYVGRYETSWNDETKKVRSVGNVKPMTAATNLGISWITSNTGDDANKATWYGLYVKQKELYRKNSSSSVVSGMIYGCQWDAIMNWMKNDENTSTFVTNSTNKGNYGASSAIQTGADDDYKVKNIYDLAGNYWEWTQEARDGSIRVFRGGRFRVNGYGYPASGRDNAYPINVSTDLSSRLQLYIK